MVVTRAHSCDIACLRSILQKPAAYVGMMGSRKRAALVHTQLAELGLPQERIDALHAPIGLSIGAKNRTGDRTFYSCRRSSPLKTAASRLRAFPRRCWPR